MLWQIRDVRPLERWEEGEQHLGKDRGRERVRKPVLRKKGDGDLVRGGRGSWLQVRGPCSNQGTQADAVCERFPPGLQVLGPGSSASQPGLEFLLSWMVRLSGHLSHSFWKMGPFFPEGKPGLRIPHPKPVKAELLWLPSAQPLAPSCCVGSSVAPQWGFHWPQLGKYFS